MASLTVKDIIQEIADGKLSVSPNDLDVIISMLNIKRDQVKKEEDDRLEKEKVERLTALAAAEREKHEEALRQKNKEEVAERQKHVDEVTSMDLPLDWENSFAEDERAKIHIDSVSDALLYSLDNLGGVDIEYIAEITSLSCKEVITALVPSIFQNPATWGECFYKGWETKSEYLSGNVAEKREEAYEANRIFNGYFERNVKALDEAIGSDLSPDDVYITLGSPWVPTDIIDSFIFYMVGQPSDLSDLAFSVANRTQHDETTGYWKIPNKGRFRNSRLGGRFEDINYHRYGTERIDMLSVLEATLNMKTLQIHDINPNENRKPKLNQKETLLALERQSYMIKEFRSWVWKDEERETRLLRIYSLRYAHVVKRDFDGCFLRFPSLNEKVSLYDYQKNAVARILLTPNTLLAHEVGAGKTYTMIVAGMELKRMGKTLKNMYVVPNSIQDQWVKDFRYLYKNANLLIVNNANFGSKKRKKTLELIKKGDYDAVIITYSSFDSLDLSKNYYEDLTAKRLAILDKAGKSFSSSKVLNSQKRTLGRSLDKLKESYGKADKQDVCYFDELGITRLFVDEIQNYKNIPLRTRINGVLGVSMTGSDKCLSMLDKIQCVQRQNGGGGVVLATGTPVTNSISDLFVIEKYLQSGELSYMGINNFDGWAGMFGEKTTQYEIDVDTNSFHLATRFSHFKNIKELSSILSTVADFHTDSHPVGLSHFEGYTDIEIPASDSFKEFLKDISKRADLVRSQNIKRTEDNLLKITVDGRKAALDMRLIDNGLPEAPVDKASEVARNVYHLYKKYQGEKYSQLIFCDSSTPKNGFNLYDEIKYKLVALGVKNEEIAYIHDAEKDKEKLFEKVNEGKIRILIGSTFKMGLGINVQRRLVAIHHVDVPWRPADMVQREGRILRPGNECPEVFIYRYITKGSFDAYSWQLLEEKQRFISQILSGHPLSKEGADIDQSVLNYSEVKALAIGNPLIKEKVETSNELNKVRLLEENFASEQKRRREKLFAIPGEIEKEMQGIEDITVDISGRKNKETDPKIRSSLRDSLFSSLKEESNQHKPADTTLASYRGFQIVLPKYLDTLQLEDKCEGRLLIKGKSNYVVDIFSQIGLLTRVDNKIDALEEEKKKRSERVKSLLEEKKELTAALSLHQDYSEKIYELKGRLSIINQKLGVEQNGNN